MGIKIESDEIDIGMGDKLDTGKLNPLLFAIVHKQKDIVRYLLEDVKISLRHFGREPGVHDLSNP